MIKTECPHGCGQSYASLTKGQKTNHSMNCANNPKAETTRAKRKAYRATEETKRKQSEAREHAWRRGLYGSVEYRAKISDARTGRVCSEQTKRKHSDTTKKRWEQGDFDFHRLPWSEDQKAKKRAAQIKNGTTHPSDETRAKQSSTHKALYASGKRKLTPPKPRRVAYKRSCGEVINLRSSWEVAVAKHLDDRGVLWVYEEIRLRWIDRDGDEHTYVADFYLPELGLIIEPHWPRINRAEQDKEKWTCILEQHHNIVLLTTAQAVRDFDIGKASPSEYAKEAA